MSLAHPNRNERAVLIRAAETTLLALKSLPERTPCLECVEFRDGFCGRWKQQVPESARPDGCAEWSEQIPF